MAHMYMQFLKNDVFRFDIFECEVWNYTNHMASPSVLHTLVLSLQESR